MENGLKQDKFMTSPWTNSVKDIVVLGLTQNRSQKYRLMVPEILQQLNRELMQKGSPHNL